MLLIGLGLGLGLGLGIGIGLGTGVVKFSGSAVNLIIIVFTTCLRLQEENTSSKCGFCNEYRSQFTNR